jgi:hypothetical protein
LQSCDQGLFPPCVAECPTPVCRERRRGKSCPDKFRKPNEGEIIENESARHQGKVIIPGKHRNSRSARDFGCSTVVPSQVPFKWFDLCSERRPRSSSAIVPNNPSCVILLRRWYYAPSHNTRAVKPAIYNDGGIFVLNCFSFTRYLN